MSDVDWGASFDEIPNTPPPDSGQDPLARAPEWPVLEAVAYHGLAGEVIATLLPETEADPAALLLQYLASVGNMIGRNPYVRRADANHYPLLFALLVGRTALSRKGTSAQNIRTVVEHADPGWLRNNVKSGISSGEGIIELIRDARHAMRKGVLECVDAGVHDKRLFLDEREFSSALANVKREGNVVSRILREAWDCPPVVGTITKHTPSITTEPFITVIGHVTFDELRQMLDKMSITNGFGNRFLYACVDRSKLLPLGGEFPPERIRELGAKTLAAVTAAQDFGQVTMDAGAIERWVEIYMHPMPATGGLVDHLMARMAPQVTRLALLYALLDGAKQISAAHLDAAEALWQFCAASARYIFNDFSGDKNADAILAALLAVYPEGMNRRTILRDVFARHTHAYDVTLALEKLTAAGKVRREMRPPSHGRTGRRAEVWFAIKPM